MKAFWLVVLLLALASLAAVGFLIATGSLSIRGPRPEARGKTSPQASVPREAVAPMPQAASKEAAGESGEVLDLLLGLARALEAGDRDAVLARARTLRTALIDDPDLVATVAAWLRDAGAPPGLRQAVVVVLGSLPGPAGKRAVLEALRGGRLEGSERAALLSLGIEEPGGEDAFERDGQPYAVEAAWGLTVIVRGPLADPEAREEAASRLAEGASPKERLAAARVLHDSVEFPEVREALLGRIGAEPDAEVTAEAAAALAGWAREAAPEDRERIAVVGRLLDAIPASEEVVRFRLAAPLSSTRLGPEEEERLASLAASPQLDARRFAVDVLGRRIDPRHPEGDTGLSILIGAALSDPSAEVRESAALALGRAATVAQVAEALVTLLWDGDWEVRAAAARSLARARPGEAIATALEASSRTDPEPLVRTAAKETLDALKVAPGGTER